jgi:hypothetical protein
MSMLRSVSTEFIPNLATSSWSTRCYFGLPWGCFHLLAFAGFDERRSCQGNCPNPYENVPPSSPVLLQRRNAYLYE